MARVADDPEPFALGGQFLQKKRAGSVHVLILVDEDVDVLSAQLAPQVRVLPQNLDRPVDQIGKVDDAVGAETSVVVGVDPRNLGGLVGAQLLLLVRPGRPAHAFGRFGVRLR